MNIYLILLVLYLAVLIYTVIRILLDTHSTSKTLAYLIVVVIIPVAGIIFYFSFGVNYRHKLVNHKSVAIQKEFDEKYFKETKDETVEITERYKEEFGDYFDLVDFQNHLMNEILTENSFELLVNGEKKFPEVLKTLDQAKSFIHLEYYAWENDIRGNQIKDVLLKKAHEGVQIRVLYDDYASRGIRHNIIKELKAAGVAAYPKIKVKLHRFANRINHRDHRKIIIVDGTIGFLGGINLFDRYDNSIDTGLYWRDTHMKFEGPLAQSLQRHFIVSWNLSQKDQLGYDSTLFPGISVMSNGGTKGLAQLMAGGPVYPMSTIMLTYFKLFTMAREKLYITNPYFIPNDSILNALKQSALSGTDVRLLVPAKSDSAIVGATSKFYFEELLEAGVRIFLYKKGFVHAKTVVADQKVSIVGTANMDIRSFDLNFEMMAVIYSSGFALQMEEMFHNDLKESVEYTLEDAKNEHLINRLIYSVARLGSSFL